MILLKLIAACALLALPGCTVPLNWRFPGHHKHPTTDLSDIDQHQPEHF